MKKVLCGVVAAMMAVSLMAGCGGSNDSSNKNDSSSQNALSSKNDSSSSSSEKVTSLIYGSGADPRGLDTALVDDNESAKATMQIYECLLKYKDDSTEVEPCLAESWDISEDGLTYTFKLRQGVKFHDGTDFNAEAVKFNVDRQTVNKTDDMPYADFVFGTVSECKVIDDYTVAIVLKQKNTAFLANMAMCFGAPIVSPTACKENGGSLMENPVGTGPYKFVSWSKDDRVVLEKFEDYWGEKGKCDQIIIKTIPDASAKINALTTGEVDIIDGIDTTMVEQLNADTNVTVDLTDGMNINYMAYNTTRLDKETRVALSQSVNVDELVNSLYDGYASKATTILPTFLPGYSDKVTQVAYDPDTSKETLAKKGVTEVKVITYSNDRPYNTATGKTLAEAIIGYFEKVGVKADVSTFDWTTYKDKIIAGDYDVCFYGWNGDNGDPDNFLNLLSDDDPSMNVARFNDEKFNEYISTGIATAAGEERNAIYAEAEQYVADEAAWLPISHQQNITACRTNIKGFKYHPTATVYLAKVEKE